MLKRILATLQQKYTQDPNESLKEQISKLELQISQKKDTVSPNSKNLVVHLLNDSPYNHAFVKTIESNLTQDSQVNHKFYVLGNNLQYMNESEYQTPIIKLTAITQELLLDLQTRADLILIQYLFPHWIDIFLQIPIRGVLSWMPWGGDYMGYGLDRFFEDFDMQYCSEHGYPINNQARVWDEFTKLKFGAFLNRVSIVFTNVEAFKILKQKHPHLVCVDYVFPQNYKNDEHIQPIQSNYLTAYSNEISKPQNQELIKLVLGNSSTPENNHFSALRQIKDVEEESNKKFFVTLVLSYGDTGMYKKILQEYTIQLFGDRCFIFDQFLNPSDFLNFISLQDVAYMNHIRSQGFGAINLYLLHNVDVFIKPLNISYDLLRYFENMTHKQFENLHSTENFTKQIQGFKKTPKYFNKNNLDLLESLFNQAKATLISIFC